MKREQNEKYLPKDSTICICSEQVSSDVINLFTNISARNPNICDKLLYQVHLWKIQIGGMTIYLGYSKSISQKSFVSHIRELTLHNSAEFTPAELLTAVAI